MIFFPVSVVSRAVIDKKPKAGVTNQLDVANRSNNATAAVDLGVCVKPIYRHYNKTRELLEFVEMNKILGVKQFTFYNHTMSPEVSCVLRHYAEAEGVARVMPWTGLDSIISQSEIRTEGRLIFSTLLCGGGRTQLKLTKNCIPCTRKTQHLHRIYSFYWKR